MNMQIAELGSVSCGTMRECDLIPTFVDVLDALKEKLAFSVRSGEELECTRKVGAIDDLLGAIEQRMTEEGYYDSEESAWDCEALFDALGEFAPEGAYFGAHPGDGADYGFWMSEEEETEEEVEA